MSIFLLTHGGASTGAIWDKVKPSLEAEGHIVYTPDLKGMGSRHAELSPNITMYDYVEDICHILTKHDLHHVILVGHSLAGIAITAVASKLPKHIAQLIYVDAVVPQNDGDTLFSLSAPHLVEYIKELARIGGNGWRYHPEQFVIPKFFSNQEDREWMLPRLSPQPIHPQETPIHFDSKIVETIPRYYIHCTEDGSFTSESAKRARHEGWRYDEIQTGHMVMVTAPQKLTRLLLSSATSL